MSGARIGPPSFRGLAAERVTYPDAIDALVATCQANFAM